MNACYPELGDIGGWKYLDTAAIPGLGQVSFWRHETGASHTHGWEVPGRAAFVLTFRTESSSDRGVAHVLEHLVGAGSRRYPHGSAIYTSMFRTMTDFANGFTETGRTSYTFATGDSKDYELMLDVLLDGVYWPILGAREFIRDGARHCLPADGDAAGYLTGAVYNEMHLKIEREDEWVSRLLARLSAPAGFAQYRHEGTPEAVAALRHEECLSFHQQWYWPGYATSFSSGAALPVALRKLDIAHRERLAETRPDVRELPDRGSEPLSAPARLLGKDWTVAEVTFPGDTARDWAWALAFTRDWRLALGAGDLDVVGLPGLMDGKLSAWCAVRGGPGKSGLLPDVAGKAAAIPAARSANGVTLRSVAAHLSDRYRSMPSGICWGLALAPLSVAGFDHAMFWRADDQADRPAHGPVLGTIDVSSDGSHEKANPWSAERAVSDSRIWQGERVSGEARVLPIRPLAERPGPHLEYARPVPGQAVFLRRPGPARRYQHLTLAVDPETICLLQPVSDVIGRRLMRAFSGDVLGECLARSTSNGWPVTDVVLPDVADSAESWHRWLLDAGVLAEIAEESASRQKQLRARVITRPAEMASRMCAARASAAGLVNEFLGGYSSACQLALLLGVGGALKASVQRLGQALHEAPAQPVVVGADAGHTPTRTADPAVPAVGHAEAAAGDAGLRLTATEIPSALMKSGVCSAAWNASVVAERDWPALMVTTAHLQRYLHERVREDGGAYGVTAQSDPLARTVVAKSQGDPEPGRTLEIYLNMWTAALDRASDDDLETAKLVAVQVERTRRAAVSFLTSLALTAPRLNRGFADMVDQVDIDSMRRVGMTMASEPANFMSLPRGGTATIK